MTHEELKSAARNQPFKPFRVTLTTGTTYDIHHPDLIMVGKRSAVIGLADKPEHDVYQRTIMVDLMHIVAIETLSKPKRRSNGHDN